MMLNKFIRIFLLIQLLVYYFLIFEKLDFILILNFIGSLVLCLRFYVNQVKERLLSNFFNLFSVIFFLYGISASLVQFIFLDQIIKEYYFPTVLYAACFTMFILGSSRKCNVNTRFLYFNNLNNKMLIKANIVFSITIALILMKTLNFYSQGILFNFSAFNTDRLELLKDTSQLDVILGLLLISSFLYLIYYYPKLSKKKKILLLVLIFFYIGIQMSVGNRRDFVPIAFGLIWVFSNIKKVKFNFLILAIFIVGIIGFNVLAVFRTQSESTFERAKVLENSFKYNEFVFPFETLKYEVNDNIEGKTNLKYGSTILINTTTIFIPREIFPDKPNSLAASFVKDRFGGGIGYAYMPITELFINFGFIGSLLSFYFLGLFILKIFSLKDQRYIYIFFTMIFDFCRGEISSLVYTFVFISLFLIVIPSFIKGFK